MQLLVAQGNDQTKWQQNTSSNLEANTLMSTDSILSIDLPVTQSPYDQYASSLPLTPETNNLKQEGGCLIDKVTMVSEDKVSRRYEGSGNSGLISVKGGDTYFKNPSSRVLMEYTNMIYFTNPPSRALMEYTNMIPMYELTRSRLATSSELNEGSDTAPSACINSINFDKDIPQFSIESRRGFARCFMRIGNPYLNNVDYIDYITRKKRVTLPRDHPDVSTSWKTNETTILDPWYSKADDVRWYH